MEKIRRSAFLILGTIVVQFESRQAAKCDDSTYRTADTNPTASDADQCPTNNQHGSIHRCDQQKPSGDKWHHDKKHRVATADHVHDVSNQNANDGSADVQHRTEKRPFWEEKRNL